MGQIRDIPGIGEKTAQRLIDHFGSETAAMEIISRHDIAAIAAIPGIGEKNAISLVQAFIFKDENISPDDFLKTREAWRVYNKLLDIIKSYTSTTYAKDKINIYFPMPSSKRDRILSVMNEVTSAISMVDEIADSKEATKGLRTVLKGIRPLKSVTPKKVRDRGLAAQGHKEYELASAKFGSLIDVILVESPREFFDAAVGYSHVIASMKLGGINLPDDSNIEYENLGNLETWQAAPESIVTFFSTNQEVISSAIQAYKILENTTSVLFSDINTADVTHLETAMAVVGDDGVKAGYDKEIDRIKSSLDRLDNCIKTTEQGANSHFKTYLENSTITLRGKDLLDAAGGGVKDLLNREMAGRYNEIIKEAVAGIVNELNLNKKESLMIDDMFSSEITITIQADRGTIEKLRQFLNSRLTMRRLEILRHSARVLSKYHSMVQRMVSCSMKLDVWFSIGLFAKDLGLVPPQLHEGTGIEIQQGRNLFIKGVVEPVDYALGEAQSGSISNDYSPERIAILSGVNSGGKTSTLDLIAQTMILSHMGFPVPAKIAYIGFVDELYYFGKSGGTMDAGAFESTIKDFSVVSGQGKMALLVDELESITEPGASARIIGGILESLNENSQSLGVFVSHMAENIMEHTDCDVRVDGIEARGLDNDLNLIVDRNPRYNYVAKSTPELIVERLARQADDDKKGFYERLLGKFK
ncbi:MAG TPA: helix-hairpin-helix domain-containing protein [Candidatus Nanoarchaeia archaeon]|nr:helix-hairpin-helix domain-containing protein [Candidatus Nanoarchaeia archaeon]